jgi:ABC-type transporter Mla maintaining outer membrane lipid asymmetry ATPase subunit MlaF
MALPPSVLVFIWFSDFPMSQDLLAQIQQSYKDLALFPLLEPGDIERLRVEYGRDVLIRLKQEVGASEKNGKLVFAGHRGCGKSTLLKRFAVEMQPQHFVVFFSIADQMESSDVSHVNILYLIGLQLLSCATKANITVADDIKKALLGWTDTERKATSEQETKSESGVNLEKVLQVINLKLQREQTFREELEKTYEKRISELVAYLDRLAAAIQSQAKKPVLVVIDDLDKLDLKVVLPIYRDNVKALFSPNFRIVFTIPVSATQDPAIVGSLNSEGVVRPQLFSVAKFYTRETCHDPAAVPIESLVALFQEMIEKRFPRYILSAAMARKMVLLSGGVMRELVRLGRECCTECMVQLEITPDVPVQIDDAILATAVRNLRNDFARQIGADYDLLVQVYQSLDVVAGETFIKMLHGLIVLEYENGDLWFDVHPIVLDLLKRRKLLSGV